MDIDKLDDELNTRCQPLRPTQYANDAARYVDVDNSESVFNTFTGSYADPLEFLETGKLIVVTGDKGSGKTSLIDRCAHHLTSSLQASQYVVVDLLLDDFTESWQRRLRRMLRWIAREVPNRFPQQVISSLKAMTTPQEVGEDEIEEAFDELSKAAASGPDKFMVIILLPPGSTETEVEKLARFMKPRLVVFAEADPEQQTRSATIARGLKRTSVSGLNLKPGTPKAGDPRLLAERIMLDEPNLPPIPAEITTGLYRPWIERTSVRELQRCIHAIRLIAKDENELEVKQIHVTRFHEIISLARSSS